MNNHNELLKADFEQCQQWMRHYDSSFSQMINFLYSGYAAIITAVYVLYSSFPSKREAIIGATMLLCFSSLVSPIFLFWLMKNRVNFTKVARWVNEIRGEYMKFEALEIKNVSKIYTDPKYPPYFNPGSTHILFLYFTAFCSSVLFSLTIYSAIRTFNLSAPQNEIRIGFLVYVILIAIVFGTFLLWLTLYFKSKEKQE